jgi:hypothetical protein
MTDRVEIIGPVLPRHTGTKSLQTRRWRKADSNSWSHFSARAHPEPLHLDDALASVNVKLCADEITSLEEPYVRHAVVGFA